MFEPANHINSQEIGYKLTITYDKETKKYKLVGYIKYPPKLGSPSDKVDGMPLYFNSMNKVIQHLTNYREFDKHLKSD
jgi:hypothetical protein